MPIMEIIFTYNGTGAIMKSSVTMLKPVKVMINVPNTREIIMKVKNGYVVQYAINGTMKTAFL